MKQFFICTYQAAKKVVLEHSWALGFTLVAVAIATSFLFGTQSNNVSSQFTYQVGAAYDWVETIPEKLYPFQREIEGQLVRGQQSYTQMLEEHFAAYGTSQVSYHVLIYRGIWHVIGSVLLLACITYIRQRLFGSDRVLYVVVGITILCVCLQEFYLHPIRYEQTLLKGITDAATWIVPMLLYMAYLYKKYLSRE